MSSSATYLYCVLQADKPPRLAGLPAGLPGLSAPRALDAGGSLWLIAAGAPLARYGEAALVEGLRDLRWVSSCALPHEAVIEHLARASTVLPMKLFTLFHDDDRAIAHVGRVRKQLERVLARVAGREEWGLRLLLDETRALALARERELERGRGGRGAAGARGTGAGAAFLQRKKAEQELVRELFERSRLRADELFDQLSGQSDDARRRPPPPGEEGKRVLLDATFLVPVKRQKSFRAGLVKLAARLDEDGYNLMLSGPWPPYNFVASGA